MLLVLFHVNLKTFLKRLVKNPFPIYREMDGQRKNLWERWPTQRLLILYITSVTCCLWKNWQKQSSYFQKRSMTKHCPSRKKKSSIKLQTCSDYSNWLVNFCRIHTMSCKLLLNLVECIRLKCDLVCQLESFYRLKISLNRSLCWFKFLGRCQQPRIINENFKGLIFYFH